MNETFCNYPGKRDDTIVAYLYGEMEADERVAFDRHLVACAPCRVELADLRDVRSQLACSVPPELPAHIPFTVDLPPGDYTVRTWESSAENGKLMYEDTKDFTVR